MSDRTNTPTQLAKTFVPGLEGVVAAETSLSSVDGEKGELIIGGYPIELIAAEATFEEMLFLLWHGKLPNQTELKTLQQNLANYRTLPNAVLALLRAAAAQQLDPMDALRMAAGALSLAAKTQDAYSDTLLVTGSFPVIVAAYHRLLQGLEPVASRSDLPHAAHYLYLLNGTEPPAATVRGLETYLNTVIDHGLNNSTFTARVVISTQTDLISAIVGAVGSLKGPLHGGAPGPALDMVFEIGTLDRAEEVLRRKISAGERLMGFGHRVYRTRDPRAEVLAREARRFFEQGGDMGLYRLARGVEEVAVKLLEEHKPGRHLQTNVEYYTALLLHGIGFETPLFTPTFAVSRVGGWTAHCLEQLKNNRIFRPQSIYTGARHSHWRPMAQR